MGVFTEAVLLRCWFAGLTGWPCCCWCHWCDIAHPWAFTAPTWEPPSDRPVLACNDPVVGTAQAVMKH